MKKMHGQFLSFAVLLITAMIVLAGCPDPTGSADPTVASVTVSPATADVAGGGTQTFTATVTGTNSPAQTVTWAVTGGGAGTSVTAGGVLTVAATETAGTTLTVTARSTADPSKYGTATVTVVAGPGLYIGAATTPESAAGTTLETALAWLGSNAESDAGYTIRLGADENRAPTILNSENLNGKTNVSITLTTVDAAPRTVQLTGPGSLFTVCQDFTLTLAGHIVIRGVSNNNTALILVGPDYLGGTLNLKDNAKITGNTVSDSAGGSAGGVRINNGAFVMTGGEISDNRMPNEGGGGVRIDGADGMTSTFTMSDGTISGNSATHGGGVFVRARNGGAVTFTMSGGTISGNSATSSSGGGLHVNASGSEGQTDGIGTFTMSGGAISNNTAVASGGGVNSDTGALTITGGTIFGNTADMGGGGVSIETGTLTITGGTISGNTAGITGGGVMIRQSSFSKTGGSISENTSSGYPEMGVAAGMGKTVAVVNAAQNGFEAYRSSDAGPEDNITLTWDGASYTTKTGFDN
jgi:hypothetical protein